MILFRSLSKFKLKACVSTISSSMPVKQKQYFQEQIANDETLIGRLFMYLNKNNTTYMASSSQSIDSAQNILNKIYNVDIDGLENNIKCLQRDCNVNTHPKDLLSILDSSSSSRINLLSVTNILRLLNIFMYLAPHKITRYKFYKIAIEQLNHNSSLMNKNELLQLLFFVALQKANKFTKPWAERCVRWLEKDLESFSVEDLCIICNSTFKTSALIKSPMILDKIKDTIVDNVIILNDPALFITFSKTIRHNRCQNENLLSTISYAFIFNKTYNCYSFGGLCHVLAIYADYFYYDQTFFEVIVQQCLHLLKTTKSLPQDIHNIARYIRNKDITRFLWILSNMNYKLNRTDFDLLSSKIMERLKLTEYAEDTDDFIKCALYFWILNYHALDIIQYCFQQKDLETGTNTDYKQRINLLLTCIRYENPMLFSNLNEKPTDPTSSPNALKQQIKMRPSLQRIISALKSKPPLLLDMKRFEFTCEVPYLNIVGITGFKKGVYKSLYIEVLDDYSSLKNTENSPTGPMALKLRLLSNLDENILKVEENIIKSMTENELKDYLKSKINDMYQDTRNTKN